MRKVCNHIETIEHLYLSLQQGENWSIRIYLTLGFLIGFNSHMIVFFVISGALVTIIVVLFFSEESVQSN